MDCGIIQLSPGRTYLGEYVIGRLGKEARLLGKHALILTDSTVWERVGSEVRESLKSERIEYELSYHEGHCCRETYEETRRRALDIEADVIIGIGGGRLLDTAKIASDRAGIRSITIPSSAATCAAAAWLSVEYTIEGAFVGNYWTKYPPFSTLIDTNLILKRCPERLNMAGIVDAMAKYPEMEYNRRDAQNFSPNAFSEVSMDAARHNYNYFMKHQRELVNKFKKKTMDDQMEMAVAKCISITGIISCLACAGKQAAISHMLYNYICCRHVEITKQYLHGEIVGASLCYQLAVNGHSREDVEDMRIFLDGAGIPSGMGGIGLELTSDEEEKLLGFLKLRLFLTEEETDRIGLMLPVLR